MLENILKIQNFLREKNLDCYLVFSEDDHGSEYVVDHYKTRAHLSGFTGSAGTLMITQNESLVWTDGRYFLQASEQLKQTNSKLMKMGEAGYPSIPEYILSLGENARVAFDFKLATLGFVSNLLRVCPNITLVNEGAIIDEVWEDRPEITLTKAYVLDDKVAGESVSSKVNRYLERMHAYGAEVGLLTSLDDISWLFNLRGSDISYNPVNYSFALVSDDSLTLYINEKKLSSSVKKTLASKNILVKPYLSVYEDVSNLTVPTLIDNKVNYDLYTRVSNKVLARVSPVAEMKTIKNPIEIKNIQKAHVIDAVAMVRFIAWFKSHVGKEYLTEISVADKLEAFRRENKNCLDLSFDTICGYDTDGAIVHYSATPETNKEIKGHGLVLIDSGAQYKYGTTDITRTLACGTLTKEEKRAYTLVLKSHIALARAIFPKGTCGLALDMLCREPLFKNFLDFRHGTGHGVGYLLNVHEGPQSISVRAVTPMTTYPFQAGMVTSNEPGLYLTNKFGIRHESLVLCEKVGESEYGEFLGFKTLTLVPFDLDAVDPKLLDADEKAWLNNYHKTVYKKLAKLVDPKTLKFLAKATREI